MKTKVAIKEWPQGEWFISSDYESYYGNGTIEEAFIPSNFCGGEFKISGPDKFKTWEEAFEVAKMAELEVVDLFLMPSA